MAGTDSESVVSSSLATDLSSEIGTIMDQVRWNETNEAAINNARISFVQMQSQSASSSLPLQSPSSSLPLQSPLSSLPLQPQIQHGRTGSNAVTADIPTIIDARSSSTCLKPDMGSMSSYSRMPSSSGPAQRCHVAWTGSKDGGQTEHATSGTAFTTANSHSDSNSNHRRSHGPLTADSLFIKPPSTYLGQKVASTSHTAQSLKPDPQQHRISTDRATGVPEYSTLGNRLDNRGYPTSRLDGNEDSLSKNIHRLLDQTTRSEQPNVQKPPILHPTRLNTVEDRRFDSLEKSVSSLKDQLQEIMQTLPSSSNGIHPYPSLHNSRQEKNYHYKQQSLDQERQTARTVQNVSDKLSRVFDDLDTLKKEMRPHSPQQVPLVGSQHVDSNPTYNPSHLTGEARPNLHGTLASSSLSSEHAAASKTSFRHNSTSTSPSKRPSLFEPTSSLNSQLRGDGAFNSTSALPLQTPITADIQTYVQQQIKLAISDFEKKYLEDIVSSVLKCVEPRIIHIVNMRIQQTTKKIRWKQRSSSPPVSDQKEGPIQTHPQQPQPYLCKSDTLSSQRQVSIHMNDPKSKNSAFSHGPDYREEQLEATAGDSSNDISNNRGTDSTTQKHSTSPVPRSRHIRNIDGDVEILISKLKSKLDRKAKLARDANQHHPARSSLLDPLGFNSNDMELRDNARSATLTHSYLQQVISPPKRRTTYSKPTLASQMKSKPFR
ncbi:hypothetical protein BASA61_001253 [Batrachochytrium salamandrivorans]|nr:hypothetical protein BASA62_001741 [Batrachochytrium salamandrivorans]KAH6577136.1 hypothetical protein BASA60_004215 [Batrachochytrium salamandrivorans]KAH6602300.1 hypothetical protein BASA61_001253 [Batrachochytrium salamandrivorans]